jgi:hypothetical protein
MIDVGVDYVLLNGSLREPYHLYAADWDPSVVSILKQKLGPLANAAHPFHEAEGFVLYALDRNRRLGDHSWFPGFVPSERPNRELAPCQRDAAEALWTTGLAVPGNPALAGDTLSLVVAYRRDSEPPSDLPFVVRMRFDKGATAQRPHGVGEAVRWLERKRGRVRDHVIVHTPFSGMYTPDMWPIGIDIYETVRVTLPRGLEEGRYHVWLDVGYEAPPQSPLLLGRGSDPVVASEAACADVDVRHHVVR